MEFLPEAGRESNSECQGNSPRDPEEGSSGLAGRLGAVALRIQAKSGSLPAAVVVDDPPALGELAQDQRKQPMRLLAVGERE